MKRDCHSQFRLSRMTQLNMASALIVLIKTGFFESPDN